jgi:hypothetical protein
VRSVIVRAVWAGVLVGKPTPTIVQIFFNSSGSLIETDGGQKEGDAHDALCHVFSRVASTAFIAGKIAASAAGGS